MIGRRQMYTLQKPSEFQDDTYERPSVNLTDFFFLDLDKFINSVIENKTAGTL